MTPTAPNCFPIQSDHQSQSRLWPVVGKISFQSQTIVDRKKCSPPRRLLLTLQYLLCKLYFIHQFMTFSLLLKFSFNSNRYSAPCRIPILYCKIRNVHPEVKPSDPSLGSSFQCLNNSPRSVSGGNRCPLRKVGTGGAPPAELPGQDCPRGAGPRRRCGGNIKPCSARMTDRRKAAPHAGVSLTVLTVTS